MPIEYYWALFDTQRGYQGLFVQATAGVDPDTLLARLQNDPRLAEGYTVYFQDNYARRNIRLLKDLSSLMTLTSGVALLGIIFGIYNAAALGTLERSRELGILLGIGFSHRSVQGFIIIRTLLLGLLAYGLGLTVAWGYAICQQTLEPLFIFGYPFDLKITPGMAAIGLAWVLGMIFIGALLSARRQLKQQVIELVSGI